MDLVFAGIFALCFYLTGAELLLLWYPASLCLFFEFLFGFFDFLKFQEKHERLLMLCLYPKEAAEFLPDTNDAIEEDYKNLVRAFADIYRTERKANEKKTESAMEYMTLWTHQIKTPITAMQLLLQEPDETMISDRKRRELLDQLFEIEQYVDMALQYTRLDTITSDFLFQEYRLFDLVKQAVKYFARTFISKKLSLDMKETDTVVVTDGKWLLFVIKQLLSNALKYTDRGVISVYMHPDHTQTLVIKDTGIGIAAEDPPRIYERGFTGENGRLQKKSTGIGLYLSKTILGRLGHRIVIISETGRGTRVELRSPDPACNPYLAFAACLAAGLDGVTRELTPPPAVAGNLYAMTAEELAERGIRGLPASLDAAVRAMEADAVVMDALGPYAVRYAAGKRREWEEYRTQISQWELDQYLANC